MRLQRPLHAMITLCLLMGMCGASVAAEPPQWKAGYAQVNVTPQGPLCICGWSGSAYEAEGKLHDLWIKILALEDAKGHRGLVITADVMGFPKAVYDTLCDELKQRYGLDRSQIKLTYSHNHAGPMMTGLLQDYYVFTDAQQKRIDEYTQWLVKSIVEEVGVALKGLAPATLWATAGQAGFAVNRRENRGDRVQEMLDRNQALKGPVDHSVPMLLVRRPGGELEAVVFGYACHLTTVPRMNKWTGDYAGVAQALLEKCNHGLHAMFFAGCGGDQNPLPRGRTELYDKYGMMLAAAVEEALRQPARPIEPTLRTAHEFVNLDFERTMTAEDLRWHAKNGAESHGAYYRWAKRMLKELEAGKSFAKSYPYAVQVWRLGADQLWISMGGEVVVDYSLKFKKRYGPYTWTNGFSFDLTAYMPSRRVWDEGGYEGGYLGEYDLPAMRWAPDLEDRITACVDRLVGQVAQRPESESKVSSTPGK